MNCIDCSYSLIKDGHSKCTYEEGECIKISVLEKENAELKVQIDKMKCCGNCKYNSYWGNELHCNYGLKEALQEDRLVECKKMDKWELKENDKR